MSALAAWRERNGVSLEMLAVAASVSVGLLERIEAGEVEPAPDVATRLHVLSGGVIAVVSWPTLEHVASPGVSAVSAKGIGGWGVALLVHGAEAAWLPLEAAAELVASLREAAELAARPPVVLP